MPISCLCCCPEFASLNSVTMKWNMCSRLVIQTACFVSTVSATNAASPTAYQLADVPAATWIVALLWPLVLVVLHELVKRREIK